MRLAAHEFSHVCDIVPLRGPDESVRSFMPQSRYRNMQRLPLNSYGAGPFCSFRIPRAFRISGVYVVMVSEELRYAGECVNLSDRFNVGYGNISPRNCFKGGQETNCRLNNLIYRAAHSGERISLWFFQTDDYKRVEADLRSTLTPAWNRI